MVRTRSGSDLVIWNLESGISRMDEKRKKKISKFLSLILRHKPEVVGLNLEENGWIEVEKLIKSCSDNGKNFTIAELREVVETNDKKRFAFDETGKKIRASQGHSVEVEIEFEKKLRPKFCITEQLRKMLV